jgi:hypothetical protein
VDIQSEFNSLRSDVSNSAASPNTLTLVIDVVDEAMQAIAVWFNANPETVGFGIWSCL